LPSRVFDGFRQSKFDRSRLARARSLATAGTVASFASPEDVIVKKLQYFREGGSEKHLRDIAGVLKTQANRIDREYIVEWAARLGLLEEWRLVASRLASPPEQSSQASPRADDRNVALKVGGDVHVVAATSPGAPRTKGPQGAIGREDVDRAGLAAVGALASSGRLFTRAEAGRPGRRA